MVFETIHIEILAGKQHEFEVTIQQTLPLFTRAKRYRCVGLHHFVKRNTSYVLLVRWNTVKDHMVDFRESSDFRR